MLPILVRSVDVIAFSEFFNDSTSCCKNKTVTKNDRLLIKMYKATKLHSTKSFHSKTWTLIFSVRTPQSPVRLN